MARVSGQESGLGSARIRVVEWRLALTTMAALQGGSGTLQSPAPQEAGLDSALGSISRYPPAAA